MKPVSSDPSNLFWAGGVGAPKPAFSATPDNESHKDAKLPPSEERSLSVLQPGACHWAAPFVFLLSLCSFEKKIALEVDSCSPFKDL